MELSPFVRFYPSTADPDQVLIYSTLRGSVLQASAELVRAMEANEVPAGSQRETLQRLGILVPDAEAERERVWGYFDWANDCLQRFTALVTLNLDCNLACPYCYEDHFRGKKYMSEATADLLVETLLHGPIAEGKEVRLDFYGGEALLSQPLVERIARPVHEAAARSGSHFSFMLVTNGTLLTPAVVKQLRPLGLDGARITMDGPPDIHNRQRPFVSGKGSFDLILANIKAVCDLLPLQLGGNYQRENYRRFPELLDLLAAEGITPGKLSAVTFSPVTPTAGEAGRGDFSMGCACSSEPWLLEAGIWLRGEILRRGWNTPRPRLAGCMVEFESDLCIAWDGGLYKCPAFMGWEDLSIGTLAGGIGDYRESHGLDVWQTEECRQCVYLPLCFGGCRFLRRLQTGAIDGVDCRRAYFDAALEEIVRQDLTLRT